MKSHERIAEMTVQPAVSIDYRSHFGSELRILAGWRGWITSGPGWRIDRQALETTGGLIGVAGDCWVIESGEAAAISVDDLMQAGMPLVVAVADGDGETVDPAFIDYADGYVFAGDTPDVFASVFGNAAAPEAALLVRDLSDGTTRMITELSAEAGRISDQLARLAQTRREPVVATRPIDAALVRRLLRMRRERERFFPADIFADPAWDMLLDLTAAHLEGKQVPVSSLCIAAAVPTTTALRWVRSLTVAGLLERRIDPLDARRSHIKLSQGATEAMMGYLRVFNETFVLR